ncbi:MAG: hypothetical protein AB8G17_01485 [Gammaproteobacteria bacterium]
MFLTKAAITAGQLFALHSDIVELIEAVRAQFQQNGDIDASIDQAIVAIYRHRRGTATDAVVRDAITRLDLPMDQIVARLDQLQSYLVSIGDHIEPFVLPLGSSDDKINLPLSRAPSSRSLDLGDLALTLGGEADLALSVNGFTASTVPTSWQGPVAPDSAVQALTGVGAIALRASGSGGSGPGKIALSSSTAGGGHLHFYHQFPDPTSRATALVTACQTRATPWDLDALHEALAPTDENGNAVGLRRVQLHGNGSVEFAGGVTVGKVLGRPAGAAARLDATALAVDARVAASLDFSLRRQGQFTFSIEKDSAGFVTVAVVREDDRQSQIGLHLNADVNVNGLDEIAKPHLKPFFDDPADLLGELDEWTAPGTKLSNALTSTDWNHPVMSSVGQVLLGHGTADELANSATQHLDGKLRTLLNETIPFWGEDSAGIANQLLERMTERLALSPEIAAELGATLGPRLIAGIDSVNARFETAVAGLMTNTQAPLAQLLQPFESIGEDIAQLQQRVDTRASAIVQPAVQLLKRYQDIRLKMIGGLQKVAQFKIGMAYAAQVNRQSGSNALLSFRVREVNATTSAIHRAVILGNLDSVWSEFQTAVNQREPWIDQVSGQFGAFAKRESSVGFSLSFGDSAISSTRVKASDVDVQVSPDGTVLVASEKISQEKIVKAFNVERAVGFSATYDLALAAREPNAFPTPLAFNLVYADDNLREKELRQFLQSLEQNVGGRSLLAAGAAEGAVEKLRDRRHRTDDGSKARVDVTLPVSISSLAALIHIPDEVIRDRAVDLLIELIVTKREHRVLLSHLAREFGDNTSERDVVLLVASLSRSEASARVLRKTGVNLDRDQDHRAFLRRLRKIGDDANELVIAVGGIRAIARLQNEIAALPKQPPPDRAQEIVDQLEAINERINDGLDSWLATRGGISGFFTEAVPAMTVTLLGLIADLAGDDATLVPIVSVSGGQIAVV